MKMLAAATVVVLVVVACGGGSSSSSQSQNAPPAGGPKCALAYYPAGVDARCQAMMDFGCCAQEQACAAANGCMPAIECVRRCPVRRSRECEMQCLPQGQVTPGARQLEELFACGKNALEGAPQQCRM